MKAAALAVAIALLIVARDARAQSEGSYPLKGLIQGRQEQAEKTLDDPGYFNDLVWPYVWEIQSTTSFSTSQVFTQSFEAARLIELTQYTGLVARTQFGAEVDTSAAGDYSLKGPLLSLGARLRTPENHHWLEFGVRLIPGWPGPSETDPKFLRLALAATLTSGVADDARWLPFNRAGYQVYGQVQSRVPVDIESWGTLLFGVHYGVVTSLQALSVPSWLGPQQGVIGNGFFETFVSAPEALGRKRLNLQLGLHVEASLSAIWPGNDALPVLADVYLAWAPTRWMSARAFYGVALVPVGGVPDSHPFGLNLTFQVPEPERCP